MASSPRRAQADRTAETRAVLIGATVELLHTVGFAGTTTALIAKRAGVTTGALHHHFPTKDDLLFGTLDHTAEHLRDALEMERPFDTNGVLNIPALIRHLWQVFYGNPEYWANWEVIIGTRADAALHPRVVAHRTRTIRTILHVWLERHIPPGDARSKVFDLFEFMLIAIRGLSLERFLDKDDAYFDRNLSILADLVGHRLEVLMQRKSARKGRE